MVNLIMRAASPSPLLHQKSWRSAVIEGWRHWRLRWLRHRQRSVLRELADDPHLLEDIGVTRDEALREAERQVWDITDVYVLSV